MASVSGKSLDGCLSGFYNGRFKRLLSVIIFSLEKSGLCCAWYKRPWRQKPERKVKCHQNLRGKHPVNGCTVILMPGFGTDWVCCTLHLQRMAVLNHWSSISFHVPSLFLICWAGIHSADCRSVSWGPASAFHLIAYRASFIMAWLPRMSGIFCAQCKTTHPLWKICVNLCLCIFGDIAIHQSASGFYEPAFCAGVCVCVLRSIWHIDTRFKGVLEHRQYSAALFTTFKYLKDWAACVLCLSVNSVWSGFEWPIYVQIMQVRSQDGTYEF